MSVLIEENKTTDIIMIQEPYWGFIKHVVSSVDANGVPYGSMGFNPGVASWVSPERIPYKQTVAHRNFVCLGAHKDMRSVIFVHKWLLPFKLRIRSDIIKHNDMTLIESKTEAGYIWILNIYNDSDIHAALGYLQGSKEQLQQAAHKIHVIAGDFNVHHPVWGGDGIRITH